MKDGLGDMVEKAIHKVAPKYKGRKCGACQRRKRKLNKFGDKIFPRKK